MNTTLVSSLIYIDDPRPRLSFKHNGLYSNWVKNLLSLASPMVFEVDDRYFDLVHSSRKTHDADLSRTILKRARLADCQAYQDFFLKVKSLMESPSFISRNKDPIGLQWTQPLYPIVTFNKLYLLHEVATLNPFQTEFFCWIDAGGIRHQIEGAVAWPGKQHLLKPDRVNVFRILHPVILPLDKWEEHSLSHTTFIQAVAFISQKKPLEEFFLLFKEVIQRCLDLGFIGAEQKIFDICYSLKPELFHVMDATDSPSHQSNIWFRFFDFLK